MPREPSLTEPGPPSSRLPSLERSAGRSWWRGEPGRVVVAVVLGVALAVACLPLGVVPKLACAVLGLGCPDMTAPAGRLPERVRLTPVQAAQSGAYVGLGDSYSSGEGVYDQDTEPVNDGADRCHRASGSYVPVIAETYRFAGGTAFYACSGATTGQLLTGQWGHPPQISRVGPEASLITLSIGGNDAGFSKVLTACIAKLPWSSACVDQDAAVGHRIGQLRADMLKVLRELRGRSPEARIVVLGYPRPFPQEPVASVDNLSADDQRWINGVARRLNDTVGAVVRDFDRAIAAFGGPGSAEYVDAYEAFTGHEVGRQQPYLNGLALDMDPINVNARSYHPTGEGYRRFAELINEQIAAGPGRPLNNYRLTATP